MLLFFVEVSYIRKKHYEMKSCTNLFKIVQELDVATYLEFESTKLKLFRLFNPLTTKPL